MNCEDLEPLLAPYVDDEATAADREQVGEHLRRCPPCAARAAGEQAARRLVQLKAAALSPPAPPALRARCAALSPRSSRQSFGWRAWSLVTATAFAGLVTIGVGYGALTHSTLLLVTGLTLDHLKCFALSAGSPAAADAAVVEAGLERDYGWRLAVPPGNWREHLTLVGARRCMSSDGTVAHVLYRHDGKPLSLFVLPRHTRGAERVSLVGHAARIWSAGTTTYVLLGDSEAAMRPVARYFEAAVR